MKYFTDNGLTDLKSEELVKAMKEKINTKDSKPKSNMAAQGTTPRLCYVCKNH